MRFFSFRFRWTLFGLDSCSFNSQYVYLYSLKNLVSWAFRVAVPKAYTLSRSRVAFTEVLLIFILSAVYSNPLGQLVLEQYKCSSKNTKYQCTTVLVTEKNIGLHPLIKYNELELHRIKMVFQYRIDSYWQVLLSYTE